MIRIRIMAFTLFLIGALFAGVQQEQNVHKYIVREAWDLLRTQYPALENADLANHIGTSEEGSNPNEVDDTRNDMGAFGGPYGDWEAPGP